MTDASFGIIGGADGPTAIFVSGSAAALWLPLVIVLLLVHIGAALLWRRKKRVLAYTAVVADVLLLDALTKLWTVVNLSLGESCGFLPGVIRLTRVHNYGAAWSSFSGMRVLLIALTSLGLAVIVWLLVKIVRHPLGVWPLLCVVGGGLGNLWNRIVLGYVIDMIDLEFMNYPIFNVADIFVVCGTILAGVYYLYFYEKCDAANWGKLHGNDPAASN